MKGELKRAMRLMWGCGEKIRWSCGCSLCFIGFFLLMALVNENLFFEGRTSWKYVRLRDETYEAGVGALRICLITVLYGNSSLVVSNLGKWLCSSKLAKSVAVKAAICNRLIIFGLFFLPALFVRIRLVCLGYAAYAKTEVFLVVAGIVYVLTALGMISEVCSIALWALFIISICWESLWTFTKFINVPLWGAIAIFAACLIVGTVLEKYGLEYTFRKRKVGRKFIMNAKIGTE